MRGVRWIRWTVTAPAAGAALGAAAAVVNQVPILLGEGGEARADRSGWSQTAEFASLILDSGWLWAALAVAVGWLVSKGLRPAVGVLVAAPAGCVALLAATTVYGGLEALFHQSARGAWVPWYWLIRAVWFGMPLGAVGAVIRRPGLPGALAALAVPVGAAVSMVVVPPSAGSPMAVPVAVTVWAAAATAAVVVVTRAVRARRQGPHTAEGPGAQHRRPGEAVPRSAGVTT